MARDEAKIRLDLDTGPANAKLKGLAKNAEATGGRLSDGVSRALKGGLGLARGVGIGVGIGAGISAVRGATDSGISDVVGEALGGIGLQIERIFLGDLGITAKAERQAREEAIEVFGPAAMTHRETVIPDAKNFFAQAKNFHLDQERGARLLNENLPRSSSVTGLVTRILEGFGEIIDLAVQKILDSLPFIGKK